MEKEDKSVNMNMDGFLALLIWIIKRALPGIDEKNMDKMVFIFNVGLLWYENMPIHMFGKITTDTDFARMMILKFEESMKEINSLRE